MNPLEIKTLKTGEMVRVRTRHYVVEDLDVYQGCEDRTVAKLACLDDDAQGEQLEVVWESELGAEVLGEEAWDRIGEKGFDDPNLFSAFLNTLRWNCVTATQPRLFQSPFRAGIKIEPYQLEPLRKALVLPRVNLFIADDVGLGKTIEAGLIANELLLRKRIDTIVVSCPPSMLLQWKDELESRFGLIFEIIDRKYFERIRQTRGYGVNPWTTFPRYLISHKLLIDENYTSPLRDWLGSLRQGSLFILDEAHHAAPASGSRYAIDSRFTRAIRDIANRFEHRLFLSATPHNGHSNSFSALLELLDPQRFTRGVKVVKSNLDAVMVRRLKEDVREVSGGFPKRRVEQVDLDASWAASDAPEIELSRLLNEYRAVRAERLKDETKSIQARGALVISHLQQRLLSSIEAFARTLAVHRRSMEKIWANDSVTPAKGAQRKSLLSAGSIDADAEQAELSEEEQEALLEQAVDDATRTAVGRADYADIEEEKRLIDAMLQLAEKSRSLPDARMRWLIEWMQREMCAGVRQPGKSSPVPGASWNDRRIIIFTEYEDTKRYILNVLRGALAGTENAEYRIEVFHGPTPPEKREAIKRAFNLPPSKHPVRILVATDAAREGLNLQAHCNTLFHFDVPWNPSRMEQRNGRIDRKLQPAPEVFCHYFVLSERPEDRILEVLVRKTKIIREELGSLSAVLESKIGSTLIKQGMAHDRIDSIRKMIDEEDLAKDHKQLVQEELEAARERTDALEKQISGLQTILKTSKSAIGLDSEKLKQTLSSSLALLGADSMQPVETPADEPERFEIPNLEVRRSDWSDTLDTLRKTPSDGKRNYQWRKDSPVRPVVFDAPSGIDEDVVQLHLSHRVVQRLLSRFLSQGFIHHDLSRACLGHTQDGIPRVVLLGRLALYGKGAARLHEEIISVTARWTEPSKRKEKLSPYAREAEAKTLELLESSMKTPDKQALPPDAMETLTSAIPADLEALLPYLEERGAAAQRDAEGLLYDRGRAEADSLLKILQEQKQRVAKELRRKDTDQMLFDFNDEEKRQLSANRRYWERWLEKVDVDIREEPERIRRFYEINSARLQPVGLVYLWPVND